MEQQVNTEKREEKSEEQYDNELGILKAGENKVEEVHKNHTHELENVSEGDKVTCAICGRSHSGEKHTDANIERLNKVFEIAQESTERASLFIQIA